MMDEAEADVLAYFGFPKAHRVKIHSTNTLERLNKEVKRRADVVGIFPNEEIIMRLLGAVLTEQNEEWLLQNRYLPQHSMAEIDQAAKRRAARQRITGLLPDRKAVTEFTPP